jgi:hypothetical protein
MSKVIILNLGQGNLEDGFPNITATLYEVGKNPRLNKQSKLPAHPILYRLFLDWLLLYTTYSSSLRMEIAEVFIERYSEQDLPLLARQIEGVFNSWLKNTEFIEDIILPIREQLNYHDEIQFIISTDDPIVRQFP